MITRAAVKIDYWNHNTKQEVIIPCHRHCDAFKILHDFGFIKGVDFRETAQGFLDENGVFLTRIEAFKEARRCGQISTEDTLCKELYSEDLW